MSTDSTEIIEYDFFDSQFGRGIIAANTAGICDIAFSGTSDAQLVSNVNQLNHGQRIIHTPGRFTDICEHMFMPDLSACELDIGGSAFQAEVWSALRSVPFGQTVSYQQLAQKLGYPRAARAVGSAVGKNRIAYLVPCHRVIRADGSVGAYRWGVARKSAMLAWECRATDGSLRQVERMH